MSVGATLISQTISFCFRSLGYYWNTLGQGVQDLDKIDNKVKQKQAQLSNDKPQVERSEVLNWGLAFHL